MRGQSRFGLPHYGSEFDVPEPPTNAELRALRESSPAWPAIPRDPHEQAKNQAMRNALDATPCLGQDGTMAASFMRGAAQADQQRADAVKDTNPKDAVKDTNPKDAIGTRKLPFSVLPWRVLTGVALAMLEGACKYGRHNYRAAGVRASVYFDAVVARHLTQWWEGEDIDGPSRLHHVDKAIAGLMVMRDSMLAGNFVDDRPPKGLVDMDALNDRAARTIDQHADKHPRHYTIADSA